MLIHTIFSNRTERNIHTRTHYHMIMIDQYKASLQKEKIDVSYLLVKYTSISVLYGLLIHHCPLIIYHFSFERNFSVNVVDTLEVTWGKEVESCNTLFNRVNLWSTHGFWINLWDHIFILLLNYLHLSCTRKWKIAEYHYYPYSVSCKSN